MWSSLFQISGQCSAQHQQWFYCDISPHATVETLILMKCLPLGLALSARFVHFFNRKKKLISVIGERLLFSSITIFAFWQLVSIFANIYGNLTVEFLDLRMYILKLYRYLPTFTFLTLHVRSQKRIQWLKPEHTDWSWTSWVWIPFTSCASEFQLPVSK